MISYFSFHPKHFNNNGDQGNLEVISYFLAAQGVGFEQAETVDLADFVLIGDGSRAAIRHYTQHLTELIPALQSRYDSGKATLIVGSTYEFFMGKIRGLDAQEQGERVSAFSSTEIDGSMIGGYRNSELTGPDAQIKGAFIATKYFGPLLAKNPEILDLVLTEIGAQKASWPTEMLELVKQIRELSSY